MNKLTIITPVYNTSVPLLNDCILSVKKAKLNCSYEHLLISDGSTDEQLLIYLKGLEESNIRVLYKDNGGVSSARNLGIKKSMSKYIICLDADDILLPQLNSALDFLESNEEFDLVYCDIECFGDLNSIYHVGDFSKFKLIYITNFISECTLISRSALNKLSYVFSEELNWSEGLDLYARLASNGSKFKYIPQPFFKYRRIYNGSSLSQQNIYDRHLIRTNIKKQFNPHTEITINEVSKYVLNHFKQNQKSLLKLFLIIYFPRVFKKLIQKGIFKNDIVVD